MYRFDNFCESFARIYTPISHVPTKDGRQTRFFRHDSIDARSEIHKRLAASDRCSLFMSVITQSEGQLIRSEEKATAPNFYIWRRHVLFWLHQTPATLSQVPSDEEAAADAKARGIDVATDFLAFVAECQDPHLFPRPQDRAIDGVDLDSVEIVSLPQVFDGWWITAVHFDQLEPRNRCILERNYSPSLTTELFPQLSQNNRYKAIKR